MQRCAQFKQKTNADLLVVHLHLPDSAFNVAECAVFKTVWALYFVVVYVSALHHITALIEWAEHFFKPARSLDVEVAHIHSANPVTARRRFASPFLLCILLIASSLVVAAAYLQLVYDVPHQQDRSQILDLQLGSVYWTCLVLEEPF